MKTKPILIITAIVLMVAASCFAFFKYRSQNKPGKNEIVQFLNAFNKHIQEGDIDSTKTYFEDQQKNKAVKVLLSVLTNKTNTGGKDKPLFKTSMNTEDAVVNIINQEFATALVVTRFDHDGVLEDRSTILFTIHKLQGGQYKITQVDAKGFVKDYVAFQNKIYIKITPEKEIYSAITLAAFKAADQLKTRYDSVVWFDHVNQKTFYYVVKGKFPVDFYNPNLYKTKHDEFKMGLVNPDLKEIIPVEYDLIHNVGGTVDGLIEVEKGGKKGLYNTDGKLIADADYDDIYPLKTGENLAVLKNGGDFFYLKGDTTISDKITDFKIADAITQIKTFGESYKLSEKSSKNIMEYNSRDWSTSIIISPSYLANLQLLPRFIDLPNPLRKLSGTDSEEIQDGSGSIAVSFDGAGKEESADNWFESVYYTIANDYLGGRGGLYQSKNVLVVDKRRNQILGFNADLTLGEEESSGNLTGDCREYSIKALNDSLFEFKTTSDIGVRLQGEASSIDEGRLYHYLQVKDGKFVALESKRIFPTQYVKLDDSYLQACYTLGFGVYPDRKTKTVDHLTKEMLQYMKNEIYASYKYRFKSKEWGYVFNYRFNSGDTTKNANVDDSLTVIDKFNISFINSKLNGSPLNIKKINALTAR
jgi:hypothetical protein